MSKTVTFQDYFFNCFAKVADRQAQSTSRRATYQACGSSALDDFVRRYNMALI